MISKLSESGSEIILSDAFFLECDQNGVCVPGKNIREILNKMTKIYHICDGLAALKGWYKYTHSLDMHVDATPMIAL